MGVASPVSEKISLWSIKVKKFNRSELAQKIHAGRDQCHVHVHQFWWVWPLQFRRYNYLSKTSKFPFWGMVIEKFNLAESAQKIKMQVGVNVTCMYISFGGRGLSGFGDMATFQKRPNFPFGAWTIVHGHRKI